MTKGVIDLFSGAGGASLGVEATKDFEVVGAVDVDKEACEVYDSNLLLTPWTQDLTVVGYRDILDHFGLDDSDVDAIIGCPPCQNFSTLRDTEPWPENEPRDELLQTFLRLIDEAKPSMILFENVPGFITKNDGKYVEKLKNWMNDNGYGFALKLVNAADYGVPQSRIRSIGIGVRGAKHEDIKIPEPTHAPREETDENGLPPHRTVADAIDFGWLSEIERGESDDDDDAHRARRHHDSTMEIIRAIPKDGGCRSDLPRELELECHKKLGRNATNVMTKFEKSST